MQNKDYNQKKYRKPKFIQFQFQLQLQFQFQFQLLF